MLTPPLIENLLNKKKSDCYPGRNKCHPNPYLGGNGHFAFGNHKELNNENKLQTEKF